MPFTKDQYREYAKTSEAVKRYRNSDKAKECRKRYNESEKGKLARLEYDRKRKQANRDLISLAKDRPCSDCSQRFDPCCMDFHHITGKKLFAVGSELHRTEKAIREEIAKCIVLCANCHRLRHKLGAGR